MNKTTHLDVPPPRVILPESPSKPAAAPASSSFPLSGRASAPVAAKSLFTLATVAGATLFAAPALAARNDPAPPLGVLPGQVLVKVVPGGEDALRSHAESGFPQFSLRHALLPPREDRVDRVGLARILRLDFPPEQAEPAELAASLAALPFVEWAEPNRNAGGICSRLVPDDTFFANQWALDQGNDIDMDLPEAWAMRGTFAADASLVIAVIDTGYDVGFTAPDWTGNIWTNTAETVNGLDDDGNGLVDDVNGYDFAYDDAIADGVNPHGENVAALVGALTNNTAQVAGVASGVQVMHLKAFLNSGFFPFGGPYAGFLSAAASIQYAVDEGAQIVNNSYTIGTGSSQVITDAIQYALDNRVTLVFSAGNDNTSVQWPGLDPDVISVAGIDSTGVRASFTFGASNYGTWVDLSAGALQIMTTTSGGGVDPLFEGTSASAPFVAGIAAMLLSEDADLHPYDVRDVLMEGAVDIDALNPSHAGLLGAGHVNALASLELLAPYSDVGGGVAGTTSPILNGWGLTTGGTSISISASDAVPQTFLLGFAGFSQANIPFLGGILLPSPDLIFSGASSTQGYKKWAFPIANPLPSGGQVWFQVLVLDAGGPQGWAFTNTVRLDIP